MEITTSLHLLICLTIFRKIRAVVKAKAERGECVGTRAPYGYQKDENKPKHLVPDADTAPIVQHSFSLCAGGKGPSQTAKQLGRSRFTRPVITTTTRPASV